MKVLVVPDIHLKSVYFEEADKLVESTGADKVVFLGDFVDDFGCERKDHLYHGVFDSLMAFIEKYPDSFICWGNHDMSYVWQKLETGYSPRMRDIVVEYIDKVKNMTDNHGYIHRIDNVLFSHAGLCSAFVIKSMGRSSHVDIDTIIDRINRMGCDELWCDESPLWVRPQVNSRIRMYPGDMLNVVGHTPVREPEFDINLLSVDTLSTDVCGFPLGRCRMVVVDTVAKTWAFAK